MSSQGTLWDTPDAISSQGSQAGNLPCNSPAGPKTSRSGREAAPASRSARPESSSKKKTRGTYGRISFASSASQDLSDALANRLRERLDPDGSPEYTLTWKRFRIASGLRISLLRASARLTSDSGFGGWPTTMAGSPATEEYNAAGNTDSSRKTVGLLSGWPTAQARDHFPAHSPEYIAEKKAQGHGMANLNDVAQLAGWVTPNVPNGGRSIQHAEMIGGTAYHKGKKVQIGLEAQAKLAGWGTPRVTTNGGRPCPESTGKGSRLEDQAALAGWSTPRSEDAESAGMRWGRGVADTLTAQSMLTGWVTPNARDWKSEAGSENNRYNKTTNLSRQAYLGTASTSSPVRTEKRGALNPDLPRWLMGYPPEWCDCAVTAMQSIRGSRRSSSGATSNA